MGDLTEQAKKIMKAKSRVKKPSEEQFSDTSNDTSKFTIEETVNIATQNKDKKKRLFTTGFQYCIHCLANI